MRYDFVQLRAEQVPWYVVLFGTSQDSEELSYENMQEAFNMCICCIRLMYFNSQVVIVLDSAGTVLDLPYALPQIILSYQQ